MAFGIAPQHAAEVNVGEYLPEHVLRAALYSANKLGLKVGHLETDGFKAYNSISASSFGEEVTVKLAGSSLHIKSVCIGGQVIDWGKNKRNVADFQETFLAAIQLPADQLSTTTVYEVSTEDNANINRPLEEPGSNINGFFSIFIPVEGYFITPILIILNLVVFAAMIISGVHFMEPSSESLLLWGANFRPATLNGEWWRLVTCCFLHIGVLHLLMNMYALMYIGMMLEGRLGKFRFLSAYLLAGIAASAASLWWHDLTISAGASGAIFGMYGVFLAMLTTNLIEKSARQSMLMSISIFVGYNLLSGLRGGIDNAAHIGGLISGMIIGYSFYPSLVDHLNRALTFRTVALLSLLLIGSSAFVYKGLPGGDLLKYDEKMQEFSALETKALALFSLPENTSNEKLISEIRTNGIPAWEKNIEILKEAELLDIPERDHLRNKILIQYCSIRILSYKSIAESIETGNTGKYQPEIDKYNKYIEEIISKLEEERY